MFRVHETWRRRLCRIGFLGGAVAPTLCVALWALWHASPAARWRALDEIERLTGLQAEADSVGFPRPGIVLFDRLTLTDRETGQTALGARTLETGDNGAALVLQFTQVELDGAAAAPLAELADRWLRARVAAVQPHVRIAADALTWRGPRLALTFNDVHVRGGPLEAGRELTAHLILAGSDVADRATLRVARRRDEGGVAATWSLVTGDAPLPCAVFQPLSDVESWLGSRAAFQGSLTFDETPRGLEAEATGRLSNVDLDDLISARFPHTLSGTADVLLERAKLHGGRIVEAAGTVEAGPGAISRTLLAAGCDVLGLSRSTAFLLPDRMFRYEKMSFGFAIDERGLSLDGRCESKSAGAMLIALEPPFAPKVLWTQPETPQPVVALLRALSPASEVQAPATRETDRLMRYLPLPPIERPAGEPATAPEARLRLGESLR